MSCASSFGSFLLKLNFHCSFSFDRYSSIVNNLLALEGGLQLAGFNMALLLKEMDHNQVCLSFVKFHLTSTKLVNEFQRWFGYSKKPYINLF